MRIVDAHRIENLLQMCGSYHGVIAYDTVISILHDVPTVDVPETNFGNWIPVSERLPEEKINENTSDFEYVLCTTTFGDVRPYKFGQTIGWSEPHFWHWNSMMDKYVVAWCELPEPYQEV